MVVDTFLVGICATLSRSSYIRQTARTILSKWMAVDPKNDNSGSSSNSNSNIDWKEYKDILPYTSDIASAPPPNQYRGFMAVHLRRCVYISKNRNNKYKGE